MLSRNLHGFALQEPGKNTTYSLRYGGGLTHRENRESPDPQWPRIDPSNPILGGSSSSGQPNNLHFPYLGLLSGRPG